MKKSIVLLVMLLILSALPGFGLSFELGGVAGGGLCFTQGSYLDGRAAQLAAQGASGATPGTSQSVLFPGGSTGAYGQIGLLSWLDLRMEIRVSYLGASRVALTAGGLPFDAYGVGFYALMLPVLARASFSVGPGQVTLDAGPFLGFVVGDVKTADTYSNAQTSALLAMNASLVGISGGVGYQLGLGPGILSVGIRADADLLPATLDAGLASGDLVPLNVILVVGYGFRLGGES
jgi:hypothetical protein